MTGPIPRPLRPMPPPTPDDDAKVERVAGSSAAPDVTEFVTVKLRSGAAAALDAIWAAYQRPPHPPAG